MQRDLLGSCVLVYLDDILIVSKTKEEHMCHLDIAFQLLQQNQLHIQPAKCKFFASEVIIIIIVTGLESHTKCAPRAHVVRLYMP